MASCLAATAGLFLPGLAAAQDTGFGSLPHTCAASGSSNQGEPFTDVSSVACGRGSYAGQEDLQPSFGNTAFGSHARATNLATVAVGAYSTAYGDFSVAIGFDARAPGESSVALGYGSRADRHQTIAVGAAGYERQITNVAAGTEATDAVNLGQMEAGDATTLATANAYADAADAVILTAANTYADAGDAATLAAANGYTDSREVAIRADMAAGAAAALTSARTYADAGDVRTLAAAHSYTDAQIGGLETVMNARFRAVDVRLDQVAAMSAAFSAMAGNDAGAGSGAANRLVVGVGNYGGETAMSVGYTRAITDRAAINAGVSFTGGEVMSGGSFGFAW